MNIKIIGAITAGTVMALVSGLLIWHKSGKTECVYTIDGRMIFGIVMTYGNKG